MNFIISIFIFILFLMIYTYVRSLCICKKIISVENALFLYKYDISWDILNKLFKIYLNFPQLLQIFIFLWYSTIHFISPFIIFYFNPYSVFSLMLINFIGLFLFFVFPVMPPRLLNLEKNYPKELSNTFDIWLEMITKITDVLFDNYDINEDINPYAAFPSLHMAWVTWSLLCSLQILNYKLIIFTVAHFFMTLFSTMFLLHHYPIDLFFGIVISCFVCIII